MTKPAKRRRTKKRRPGFFAKNKILVTALGIAAFALIALVFFARLQEQPKAPVVSPAIKPSLDNIGKVHAEIDSLLAGMELDPGTVQRDLDHSPARYSVTAEFPPHDLVAGFAERLRSIPGDYDVRIREANSLTVEKSRQTRIVIHFMPPAPDLPDGPLMTIIMDDLGRSALTAEMLVSFPEQVTFAVLPGEPHAVQVAEIAHTAGHEVLLHVPMEPQGYPAVNPGDDALFVAYSDAEIRSRFDLLLARVPYVTGTNNHMGSRFTEDARALSPVMESLREKGFFFVDSRTTGQSRVPEVAHRFGVPTLNRDIFLDNVAEVDAIVREIRRLEERARSQGAAIGICHPYPETLEALRRELPEMHNRGISVVPVSVLLQKQASISGIIERAH
jgi:polysaccharide deacetylase 2 family uncharacterized protein YibQ